MLKCKSQESYKTSWLHLREDFIRPIAIAKKVDLNSLITHKLLLDEASEGFKKMDERKENIVKIILSIDWHYKEYYEAFIKKR